MKNNFNWIYLILFFIVDLSGQPTFEDWHLPLGLQDEGWYPPPNQCVDYTGAECPAGNPANNYESCESYPQCDWNIHWRCVDENLDNCIDGFGQIPTTLPECSSTGCDWITTDCGGTYGGIWDGMCFGYPDTIYIGLSDTASNGFRYGEDQINTPILEGIAPYSDTYFYHSDWLGDVDVNNVTCEWVRFSTDIRQYNAMEDISEWEIQASMDEIPHEVDYELSWPDFDLPEEYDIFLYHGSNTWNMRLTNSITVEREDLVPSFGNNGFHSNILIRIGGCLQEGPDIYYTDQDLDGLGTGDGVLLCPNTVGPEWTDNDYDIDDTIYCTSNIIDECGICNGDGLSEYFFDLDGDGLGYGDSMVLCPNDNDIQENMVENNNDINDNIFCESNVIDLCLICDGFDNDIGCGCFENGPQSYYFDSDGDGLGFGQEFIFCETLNENLQYDISHFPQLLEEYVTNNNDSNDQIFCESNIIDDCFICNGTNNDCNVFGNGITEFNAIYRSHSGNIELDWNFDGIESATRGIIIIEYFEDLNLWTSLDSTFDIFSGEFDFNGSINDTGRVLGAIPYDRFFNCYKNTYHYDDPCLIYGNSDIITFEQTVEWIYDLSGGNNLISFPALPYNNSFNNILGDYDHNFYYVISQGIAAFHNDSDGDGTLDEWSGNLNEFLPNRGYWLSIHPDSSLEFRVPDSYLTSSEYIYELAWGNNLISYIGTDYSYILNAIPNHIQNITKFIIGQGVGFFHLDTDNDGVMDSWSGNLNNLRIGKGYWLNLVFEPDDTIYTMVWNEDQDLIKDINPNPNIEDLLHIEDFSFTQSSLQSFYLIRNLNLPESITDNGLIISYNNSAQTILGYRQWYGEFTDIPVMGKDNSVGTELYITEGQIPKFKYYDQYSGKIHDLYSDEFIPDWTPNNYVVIENLYLNEIESENQIIPSQMGLFTVYPNPFNPACNISFELKNSSNINLNIFDINGNLIKEIEKSILNAGVHKYIWNADQSPSGIYLAKLENSSGIYTKKLLLIK